MPISPLYVCPDCEPGPYMYAGKIIAKLCSVCLSRRRDAQTGYDRARTGADRLKLGVDRTPRGIPVKIKLSSKTLSGFKVHWIRP